MTDAFGGDAEARLVAALRADGAVICEFVAADADAIVGHVLFSRLTLSPADRRVAALAPASVSPPLQRCGIGSALVRAGLEFLRRAEWDAVAVLGDPTYYGRFGFGRDTARVLESAYTGLRAYQALELRSRALAAGPWRVTYPRAFANV